MEDTAWQALATQPSDLRLAVICGDTLILYKDSSYVQDAPFGSATHYKTGGDQFLPEEARISVKKEQQLVAFGRQPPGPPDYLNHTYGAPVPPSAAQVRHAVELMVRTLHDIRQPTGTRAGRMAGRIRKAPLFTVSA